MANALYPSFKELLLSGGIDLSSDAIQCALVDLANYTYSSAHDFFNDVNQSSAVTAAELDSALGTKTLTAGVFDAADNQWGSVTGPQSEAIVVYKDTGTDSTGDLIAYLDTGVTGFPITPDGNNITLAFNGSGIFAL